MTKKMGQSWIHLQRALLLCMLTTTTTMMTMTNAFVPSLTTTTSMMQRRGGGDVMQRSAWFNRNNRDSDSDSNTATTTTATTTTTLMEQAHKLLQTSLFSAALALSTPFLPMMTPAAMATDALPIAACLFQKCQVPLAKCITNPMCLANVACINTCNNRPDEIECQIKCGNLFENAVVGEFNKCAISTMNCVPQKADEGLYPIPPAENLVPSFDTKLFNGKWYISAGQNPLFDIFPCQVHFFTEPEKGLIFGQLNWRIEEPDGEFFTRDALQRFIQDPKQPGHLINHDNEYLHYKDDWYIIDYEYDDNPAGIPPFAFVYYRGSNDAWDGYGGVVVYTRAAKLPDSLLPRLRAAAQKVNFDFDRDFTVTDNTCPVDLSPAEKLLLREKFLGNVVLNTEQQLQVQATRVRGNAVNVIQSEEKVLEKQVQQAEKALEDFAKQTRRFEMELIRDATLLEKELEKDVGGLFSGKLFRRAPAESSVEINK